MSPIPPSPPPATAPPSSAAAQSEARAEAAVTCEINRQRRLRGLPALHRRGALARAGDRHATDMVRRGYFSHVSPGGQTMAARLRAAGYAHGRWAAGEVLAWGTRGRSTPAAVVAAWMRSAGHRAVLLDSRYRDVGVGIARGNPTGRSGGRHLRGRARSREAVSWLAIARPRGRGLRLHHDVRARAAAGRRSERTRRRTGRRPWPAGDQRFARDEDLELTPEDAAFLERLGRR